MVENEIAISICAAHSAPLYTHRILRFFVSGATTRHLYYWEIEDGAHFMD